MNPNNVIHRRRAARNEVKESRLKAVEAQQEVIQEAAPKPKATKKRRSSKKKSSPTAG